jgi:3-deoxy-D-manno-octulosonate 8-phosphate phosphatase (KDO 8-P phosphatase)
MKKFIFKRLFPRCKAKKIKIVIMDVDGVLTDGKIVISDGSRESKNFSVYDGVGINLGREKGLKFAIITARKSEITSQRAKELGIEDVFQIKGDKLASYEEILSKHGLKDCEAAYIGDDIHDERVMKRAGLSAAPSNAQKRTIKCADYITRKRGGEGAVRELIDLILKSRGLSLTLKSAVFILSCFVLFACSPETGSEKNISEHTDENTAREKVEGGFHYTASEKGVVVLEIQGDKAEGLGDEDEKIIIENPKAVWRGENIEVKASGKKGIFSKTTNNIIFEEEAVVLYGDDGRISAERIKWIKEIGKVEAEGSVTGEFKLALTEENITSED